MLYMEPEIRKERREEILLSWEITKSPVWFPQADASELIVGQLLIKDSYHII